MERLGYPSYLLVILGIWKLLGTTALLSPGFPLLKEWAYAGVFFADTGAIASHVWVGYGYGEVATLAVLLGLTVTPWAFRPASRRLRVLKPTAAAPEGDGRPTARLSRP